GVELADAGGDPRGGLGARGQPVDERTGFAGAPSAGGCQLHLLAAPSDRLDGLERQRPAVKLDHGRSAGCGAGSGTRQPRVSSRTRARSSGSSTVVTRPASTTRPPWAQTSGTARSRIPDTTDFTRSPPGCMG